MKTPLALLIALTAAAHADVLPPVQDSSSLKGKLTVATGKASTLAVSATRTGYVLFNIQSLPAQLRSNEITNARLRVYFPKATKPGDIAIHAVLPVGPLWSETATTLAPSVSGTPLAMFPAATVVGKKFVEVDVTATVQAWHASPGKNYGFAFLASGATNVLLGAKEGPGSGYPAELDIEITRTVFPAAGSIGTDEIEDASVSNAKLASPSLTINAGTGLTGGGAVSLGGNTTLALGTNLTLGGTTSGTFSGNGAALTGIAGANIAAGSVSNTQLAAGAAAANLNANGQSGVPSGGLVLSATDPNAALAGAGYVKLGATTTSDIWQKKTDTVAPAPRAGHSAVWTGNEMIIWGGFDSIQINTGARYNPGTDTWLPMSTAGAPSARSSHTAVWTGSEMIVWGGQGMGGTYSNTGGRYNPATNTWSPAAVNTVGAPSGRVRHSVVWTGSEMIVWGGLNSNGIVGDNGRYNPATNTWTTVSAVGTPVLRHSHTAVWSGTAMIIFGGFSNAVLNTGGVYNPATDSWVLTSLAGAPASRQFHTAVWTGSEMIVWGGKTPNGSKLNDGGRYNPSNDTWALNAVSTHNAPAGRDRHTVVWTGTEMIVWGGAGAGTFDTFQDGGRYNAAGNSWIPMANSNAPASRDSHSAVWTNQEMIISGGSIYTGNVSQPNGDTFSYTLGRTLYLYQRP